MLRAGQVTVIEKLPELDVPVESVTVIGVLTVPADVGVPLMTPAVFMLSPTGSIAQ